MTNSHQGWAAREAERNEATGWLPLAPPPRGERNTATLRAFHAYMLMPGLSIAFHAATLKRSRASVAKYLTAAKLAVYEDSTISEMAHAILRAMTADDGLCMAQQRGTAQLPYWSRLAIFDYRKRGLSQRELANAFRCSRGTIANVLQGKGNGYSLFSGERQLTDPQRSPPGKWAPRSASRMTR